ncbi:hypothetical protein AAH979_01775 [Plantactinospora sp. ZYX-F-223]|uniref:hypothetical protein n=1 Tax=Plantactinospora sp. ZYX-F-223 TaxID=3144103 RepID=UPI0031FE372B
MWSEEIVAGRPAWRHTPSGVVFRKVPGGTFRMGLSDAELGAVRAIERAGEVEDTIEPFLATAGDAQPVREVRVEPFLIARHPLTVAQVRHGSSTTRTRTPRPTPPPPGSKTTWTTCSACCRSRCPARPSGSTRPEPAPPR